MSLEQAGLALEELAIFTAIRESALVYPILLSLHLTTLAVFAGTLLATNLRLLRWALVSVPLGDVVDRLRPWKHAGLTVMVAAGGLLAGSKASEYFVNPYFQAKMALLGLLVVHAVVFGRSVYRHPGADGTARATAAGASSLVLWIAVLSMGRWVAYFD
jgi:hypothetical protein